MASSSALNATAPKLASLPTTNIKKSSSSTTTTASFPLKTPPPNPIKIMNVKTSSPSLTKVKDPGFFLFESFGKAAGLGEVDPGLFLFESFGKAAGLGEEDPGAFIYETFGKAGKGEVDPGFFHLDTFGKAAGCN